MNPAVYALYTIPGIMAGHGIHPEVRKSRDMGTEYPAECASAVEW